MASLTIHSIQSSWIDNICSILSLDKKKKEEEGSHALIRTMYKLSQILVNFFFFFKDYFIFFIKLIYLF